MLISGQEPRERADAARNRERVLAAAAQLVEERGIGCVSMDDIARAACVGTGTVYRRFGDRAGLALALLDEESRAFQDALISGPPPLGPGVPASERLSAFGLRYLDLLDRRAELMVVGAPAERGGQGPDQFNATHLAILVGQAAPQLDGAFTARALLAALNPAQHLFARRVLGWELERLQAGWVGLVEALVSPVGPSTRRPVVPTSRARPADPR